MHRRNNWLGWRITKKKQSHQIDLVVALAMSALAAVKSPTESNFDWTYRWIDGDEIEADPHGIEAWRRQRNAAYLLSGGRTIL